MKPPRHILIGTDFSDASAPALAAGSELARTFGARVTLVHVFDVTDIVPPISIPQPRQVEKALESEMEAKVQGKLGAVREQSLADIAEVDVAAVSHPNPAHGVCTLAEELDVDLIVLATHGRTGLRHLLIGSVAERVVRHARRPVLVVRSHAP